MPYPIKNTATLQRNSLQKTNFAVGVNQGGYGSTSSTAFWNGKTPNINQYVVYVGNGTSSPTMYVVATDNELITLSNTLGIGTNYNITMALNAFMAATNMICFNMDTPNIVTSGLTLNLDAGFVLSYPRDYTTWTDLSGSGNTGTLVNSPTYSSSGGGCIVSDGVNDGVTVPDSSSLDISGSFTLDGWVWFNQHKDYGSLLVKGTGGNGSLFNYCFFFYASSIICGFGDGSSFYSVGVLTTPNVPINTWHHIVGVYDLNTLKFYLNGVLMNSVPVTATPYQNTDNLNVIQTEYPIDGKVISAKVYNRVLSATEILQNYYAGLQRFIPTSTTTLWLDGENTNTRVITPTIAYDTGIDLSNGTLMNSMVLSHRDGGTSFLFDGVDDYIDLTPYHLTTSTASLTVSIWFKGTSTIGSNTLIKFGSVSSGWLLGFSSGGIYFNLYTTSGAFIGGGISASLYVWHNVTFTYNGTAYVLYLNGSQVYTTSLSSGSIITGGNTVVNIGRDGSSNTNYLNGKISIVRTFAETLTATQVLNIYNAGKPRHGL